MGAFDPVPFDVATARQAADACRSAAVRVDEVAGSRRTLATTAERDWQGPHRDQFEWDVVELTIRHERTASALRAFAASIEAAIDVAAAENRRRADAAADADAGAGTP